MNYTLKISDHLAKRFMRYTRGINQEQFLKDELIYDAVLRNLMIIGEAAKNLPEDFRKKFNLVEWKKICGLRTLLLMLTLESTIPYYGKSFI